MGPMKKRRSSSTEKECFRAEAVRDVETVRMVRVVRMLLRNEDADRGNAFLVTNIVDLFTTARVYEEFLVNGY